MHLNPNYSTVSKIGPFLGLLLRSLPSFHILWSRPASVIHHPRWMHSTSLRDKRILPFQISKINLCFVEGRIML